MYIILDTQAIEQVLEHLNIEYKSMGNVELSDKEMIHEESKAFYFAEKMGTKCNASVVELTEQGVWVLDELLNPVEYKKVAYQVADTEEPAFYYVRRIDASGKVAIDIADIKRNKEQKLQIDQSDIYLMIPGKINLQDWESILSEKNDFFHAFKAEIDTRIEEEYNSEFAKCIQRKCIASVTLKIGDFLNGMTYLQKAIVAVAVHDTGFCVVEIMVPNCNIGGNKLLNYYCGNQVKILYDGKEFTVKDFLEEIKVEAYGKKRSIVFAYSDLEKQEVINALANEEFPMGTIGGAFKEKVETQNIAQYDTAEVYVSHETMIEKCKFINNNIDERLSYHAIELFFVELLLFQDAAVDKVYYDLRKEELTQREYGDTKAARIRCEQLSFDMAQAMKFGDFEQFNFPTTRESANRIAGYFGINAIFEKYKLNKEFLDSMVDANDRQMQEHQDELKNKFLIIISAIAFLGTLGDIAFNILSNTEVGSRVYGISSVVMVVGYVLYLITDKINNIRIKKLNNKNIK